MKFFVLVVLLFCSDLALAAQSFTSIECATTDGRFSGKASGITPPLGFTASELKDILLGTKQVATASMPYPSDVVVAPNAVNLQEVVLSLPPSPFGFSKAMFFAIEAKNFTQLNVFCTMKNVMGL